MGIDDQITLNYEIAKFVIVSNVILSLLKDCRTMTNLACSPPFDKLRVIALLYFVIQNNKSLQISKCVIYIKIVIQQKVF